MREILINGLFNEAYMNSPLAIPSLSALLNHKVQVSLRSPGILIQPVLAEAL